MVHRINGYRLMELPPQMVIDIFRGRWNDECDIKIGDRVVKCNSLDKDAVADGEIGKVVGNMIMEDLGTSYMVCFEGMKHPILVMEKCLKKIKP